MRYRRLGGAMTSDLFSLAGKIILVTGASRGLGRAMAAAMADAGGHVVLNGRDRAALEAAAAAIRDAGGAVVRRQYKYFAGAGPGLPPPAGLSRFLRNRWRLAIALQRRAVLMVFSNDETASSGGCCND